MEENIERRKNLHFCTKEQIRRIKYNKNNKYVYIRTYRTGYVPSIYSNDIINLNERDTNKHDKLLKQGLVIAVVPIQYKDIRSLGKHEILESYKGRQFKPEHWFFEIIIRKWSVDHYKTFETDLKATNNTTMEGFI